MPPSTIQQTLFRQQYSLGLSRKRSQSHSCHRIRNASTYRRHVQRLSIPPAPSFTQQSSTPQSTHIIFNPPSSAPNIYHTPLKFLPPGDKRRTLYETAPSMYNLPSIPTTNSATKPPPTTSPTTKPGTALHETSLSLPSTFAPRLPPAGQAPSPLKPAKEKRYHLTAADMAEMQRLRNEDPKHWTQARLAEKFNCSQFFVRLVAKHPGAGREHSARLDEVKNKWGRGRTLARKERGKRKDLWGRDA